MSQSCSASHLEHVFEVRIEKKINTKSAAHRRIISDGDALVTDCLPQEEVSAVHEDGVARELLALDPQVGISEFDGERGLVFMNCRVKQQWPLAFDAHFEPG